MSFDYLLYLRKSNGRKAVPRQRALTTAMIRRNGGIIPAGWEFSDADRTAWRNGDGPPPGRPEFSRMIAVLRSRTGLRVAAWHADRLTRNEDDTAVLAAACKAGGHLIETVSGGTYDLSTANGRKRLRDDASDAIYEVDHLQERVLEARAEIAADGRWLGGKRPFGWVLDENPALPDGSPWLDEDGKPVNGVLVLLDREEDAIREGSVAVLAGQTLGDVTRAWNDAGLTGTGGAPWTRHEVRAVLIRPRNAGLMEHRGQITGKAQWPAIVSEDTWRAVCAVLDGPHRATGRGPGRQHFLSGIMLCGECGHPDQRQQRVYRCRPAAPSGTRRTTRHPARDAGQLDAYIAYLAVGRLKRPDAAGLLQADTSGDRDALLARERTLKADYDAQWDLYRQKVITAAELREGRADLGRDLEGVRGQLAELDRADVLAPMLADPEAAWEAAGLELRRAVVQALMYVTLMPSPHRGRPVRGAGLDPDGVDVRWVRSLPSDG